MIQLQNIHKFFGENEVLKGISFAVPTNSVTVILGPSGSGKTTLLRTINFLEEANIGHYILDELHLNIETASQKEKREFCKHTAMVFQNYNLFANRTALKNISEALIVVKKTPKKEAFMIAQQYLDQVGLGDKAGYYPAELSGGQQQRIGIARALALKPKVILFDEPTSSLDPELVGEVLAVMKGIANSAEATMIVVTHEIALAREVADQIVFMEDGVIVEQGTAKAVLDNPQQERTKQFLARYYKGERRSAYD